MAAMIDENRLSYSLDSCCAWRDIPGKDEKLLKEVAAAFGIPQNAIKNNLWRLPERYVAPYAEQDVDATIGLFHSLFAELEKQDLYKAYQLEIDLIPMFLDMRNRGVRVNVIKAEESAETLQKEVENELQALSSKVAFGRRLTMTDLLGSKSLEAMFNNEGLGFPRTPKTKVGKFESEWLRSQDHWLPQKIADIRFRHMVSDKFLRNYIVSFASNGRLHPEIHALRSDEGGARSYRLSYSNPPLQQMSAGNIPGTEWVKETVRGLFLPEQGDVWFAPDYSQQEPRLTVHYAALAKIYGWEDAVAYYSNNTNADYHQMVADMAGIPRKLAKIINLGLAYGMGVGTLADGLRVAEAEALTILEQYHVKVPFIKGLTDRCSKTAQDIGFIRLLDGARCRFDMWEPSWKKDKTSSHGALPFDRAVVEWKGKRIRRAFTHKAMNRLIQGGAARQVKMAMRACYQEGEMPLLQMHDELDFSLDSEARGQRIGTIMRDIVKLKVPVKVDEDYGHNWGDAKYKWSEL
jgi:DNA polymerase I-like protein with 3'-5' exonuclease and polymerase domains